MITIYFLCAEIKVFSKRKGLTFVKNVGADINPYIIWTTSTSFFCGLEIYRIARFRNTNAESTNQGIKRRHSHEIGFFLLQ